MEPESHLFVEEASLPKVHVQVLSQLENIGPRLSSCFAALLTDLQDDHPCQGSPLLLQSLWIRGSAEIGQLPFQRMDKDFPKHRNHGTRAFAPLPSAFTKGF